VEAQSTERKYADGLGRNIEADDEELFMESSCGFEKEEINHTLDDAIKLIIEYSNALHYIIGKNKKASIESILRSKKATFGIQIIKRTLTLTKMTLDSSCKWKLVDMRSPTSPINWAMRFSWMSLFELLATLYVSSRQIIILWFIIYTNLFFVA
jgi:hypothetical protein